MEDSSPHPWASLIAPLRYACRNQFAQLSTVRNLRALFEGALHSVGSTPAVSAESQKALKGQLPWLDSEDAERRKEALKKALAALALGGVALPPDLAELASPSPNAASAVGSKAASAPEPPPPPPRPAAPRMDAAKLLSIAPSRGPLALPLRASGLRLHARLLASLQKRGISSVGEVLFFLPRAHEDRRQLRSFAEWIPGERGVGIGVVRSAGEVPIRGGRRQFRALLSDGTASLSVTYFRSGPWLKAKFPVGKRVIISGELRASSTGREMAHPEVEPADELEQPNSLHFNRWVPIYPSFERFEQKSFRELCRKVLDKYASQLEDPLPDEMRKRLSLPGLSESIERIHFPGGNESAEALASQRTRAHLRLAFDELFFLQLGVSLKRQSQKSHPGIAFNTSAERLERASSLLPFQLTGAQRRAVADIQKDMAKPEPMNRLLQGDVGSGKTAVAALAAALALQDGHQVALMAPTEILAAQHRATFERIFAPWGKRVALLSATGGNKQRQSLREALAQGDISVAVGTHALIQEGVRFSRLGLVLIDEQHRFGVVQRQALIRMGREPDVLVMTATPIPRTLAMTLYGDLDVSVIDELPPGRTPVRTRVFNEKQRGRAYEAMAAELQKGRQCYVVYPLVEESEKVDLIDATRGAQSLAQRFAPYKVGLLHGQMKPEEKDAIMGEFRSGQLSVLVCTTVVEVGVDVPNASVMAIESAERFGLSQLHQLRGRVGRGAAESHCFLLAGYAKSKEASERLSIMEQSTDGFVIAEKDLELRGPGEFLGTRQSGLPELVVANLARDAALLTKAQKEARRILSEDSTLAQPAHQGMVRALEERWEGRLSLARIG
jgi:ATP-dependent DNA helicase RecG